MGDPHLAVFLSDSSSHSLGFFLLSTLTPSCCRGVDGDPIVDSTLLDVWDEVKTKSGLDALLADVDVKFSLKKKVTLFI